MQGRLTQSQAEAISAYVEGKEVWDIGAGDGRLSVELCGLGAASVVAVDYRSPPESLQDLIRWEERDFRELGQPEMQLAFLSWPTTRHTPWDFLEQAQMIAYLGKCTDGTYCGSLSLWEHFSRRELLVEVPDKHNNLLIFGEKLQERRAPLSGEERAGWDQINIFGWEELYDNPLIGHSL